MLQGKTQPGVSPSVEAWRRYDEGKAGAELYYPDDRVPVTRMSDVDKSIVELLGLNHKQFTQITMIAQGQFRKFWIPIRMSAVKSSVIYFIHTSSSSCRIG